MRVEVTKRFKDKHTGEIRQVGEIYEVTKERYAEITEAGDYVAVIVEDAVTDELDNMNAKELREYAKEKCGLTFEVGTKKALMIEEIRRKEAETNE